MAKYRNEPNFLEGEGPDHDTRYKEGGEKVFRTTLRLKALNARPSGDNDGTYILELEGRPLEAEEEKILQYLFPNLTERVYELLSQEALLTALVPYGRK